VQAAADLAQFHERFAKPVLLADSCVAESLADGSKRHSPEGYQRLLEAVRGVDGCVGLHLCGAYLKNGRRRRGLRDADESPDVAALGAIRRANRAATEWMNTYADGSS